MIKIGISQPQDKLRILADTGFSQLTIDLWYSVMRIARTIRTTSSAHQGQYFFFLMNCQ